MGSVTDDRRAMLITALGLSATVGARYSIADLERMYGPGGSIPGVAQPTGPVGVGVAVDGLWQDASPLASGWLPVAGAPPQYMRDSDGVVHFRGKVTGYIGTLYAFFLPAGYWPLSGTAYMNGYNGTRARSGSINAVNGAVSPTAVAGAVEDQIDLSTFMFQADGFVPSQALETGAIDGVWFDMAPLLNGATPVAGYPPQYMKDSRGIVHFRGRILVGTAEQVFALPVGYRNQVSGSDYFNFPNGGALSPSTVGYINNGTIFMGLNSSAVYTPGVVTDISDWIYSAVDSVPPVGGEGARDGEWIPMVLVAPWVQSGAIVPAYMKDSRGVVHFRGSVTGETNPSIAFTLPVGFRPISNNISTRAAPNDGYIATAGYVVPKQTSVAGAADVIDLARFVYVEA